MPVVEGVASAAPYDPNVFDRLNEFYVAKRGLNRSREKLCPLGDIFVRHELFGVLGANLLHKHFNIDDGEVLVRRVSDNSAVTRPERYRPDLAPYLWRPVAIGEGSWNFYPLEFLPAEQWSDDFSIDESGEFLFEFAEQSARLGVGDLFGVGLKVHRQLTLRDNEILVETTDLERRELVVRPVDADSIAEELTETFWEFTPPELCGKPGVHAKGKCISHCSMHCKGHCKSHCNNHCSGSHCTNHCRGHGSSNCVGHCVNHCASH
ncbi:hypothetical protein [Pseudofrankia sp. DC12]|uniref:hypothetical protein n=1 Tax=Pseudofrankia sp. DC12 TaxID=683315 RepID=UPI000AD2948B|nr:hypothetical protein [Pseudofrankia sp. DC12]